jgi:undecaprenyl-diphosphatase
VVILIGIISIIVNKLPKKKIVITSILSLPLSLVIAKIASHFIYNPRPFVVLNSLPLISHAADNGFPSDHTLICAAVASIVFLYNKKLGIFLFVLTAFVGLSRILALVHHPIDILGSILIAISVTFFSNKIAARF